MKSVIVFDLIFLSTLLILIIWVLKSLTKLVMLLLLMGTMTYFHNGPLVVIFNISLGFSWLLIIFWIFLIFLFWSLENVSLIFNISLAILEELAELAEICAYDYFVVVDEFFLKYFEILFTSLAVFAGIGGGRGDIYEALTVFLSFKIVGSLVTWGLNFDLTLFLNILLVLLTIKLSQWDL